MTADRQQAGSSGTDSSRPVGIGIVGCGAISGAYMQILPQFGNVAVVHCADLEVERAKDMAGRYSLPNASDVDGLFANPDVEIVLNLTIPGAHADVALRAVESGRSVYTEKPLAVSRAEGRQVIDAAAKAGVLVGGAPDTFLGGAFQGAAQMISDGRIGKVIGGMAAMLCHGHEGWHPRPHFYYQRGGGPLFDMGPYYLTALVAMLGPIHSVAGFAATSFPTRTVTSQPHAGDVIDVEVPTHVVGVLSFESGAVVSLTTSFDVWAGQGPPIQLFGEKGSMQIPDPNGFGGEVRVFDPGGEWVPEEYPHGFAGGPFAGFRGLGLVDMARALREGGTFRASGELTYHVLDVMESLHELGTSGGAVEISSTCSRPEGLRPGLLEPLMVEATAPV